MERKSKGDPFYADDANELADGVARISGINGPGVTNDPSGISLRAPRGASRIVREPAVVVEAANVGAADLKAYAPCTLYYHVFQGEEAQYKRVLQVKAPEEGDEGWFGICAEPILQNRVGRVYVVGCCLARVKNPDFEDFAEIVAGEDYLQGAASGSAQIIWQDSEDQGDGVYLALIRFPIGGGDEQNVTIVKLVATVAVTASGTQTIDGVGTATDDLVLLTHQADSAENGVWKCDDAGAWTRQAGPYDAVGVVSGNTNALTWWIITSATPTYSKATGDEQNVTIVKLVATVAVTASGTQTIDGVGTATDDLVLLTHQADSAENGVWKCDDAGAWTRQAGPYDAVGVVSGNTNALTWWIITSATPTYSKAIGGATGGATVSIAYAATTASITLSGQPQTLDGINCGTGKVVLVKNQSTASQNGLYTIPSSGAWTKSGQPNVVAVVNGTVAAKVIFILTATNTYSGMAGVYQ